MCTIQLWLGNLRRKADINVDFFSSGGGVVNIANRFDLQLQPEDWDPNVAGDDEPHTAFEIGLRHMNEGSYVAATQSFWQCINSESGSSEAVTSVKCIFDFARAVDRDLNQLRDSFLDIAIENETRTLILPGKQENMLFIALAPVVDMRMQSLKRKSCRNSLRRRLRDFSLRLTSWQWEN